MTRIPVMVLIAIFLCGCSQMVQGPLPDTRILNSERSVWQLTIGNPERPRYTGLLALRDSGDTLDAVLLDTTGISLLAERIGADGGIEVLNAVPLVREKGLPPFLGKGLSRMFPKSEQNIDLPCFRDGLEKVCFGMDREGRFVRSGSFGPFRLWSVEYFINKEKGKRRLSSVVLDQGWLVPGLRLERIDSDL